MLDEPLNPFEVYLARHMDQLIEGQKFLAQTTEEKIQEIYAFAYSLYQRQQDLEASYFFRLLVIARPQEAKFWKALGACLQMQKNYDEAIHCYMCCEQANYPGLKDPYLYVHTADCYFALGQADRGLKALEVAHSNAKQTQNTQILQHVAFMQQRWSKTS